VIFLWCRLFLASSPFAFNVEAVFLSYVAVLFFAVLFLLFCRVFLSGDMDFSGPRRFYFVQ